MTSKRGSLRHAAHQIQTLQLKQNEESDLLQPYNPSHFWVSHLPPVESKEPCFFWKLTLLSSSVFFMVAELGATWPIWDWLTTLLVGPEHYLRNAVLLLSFYPEFLISLWGVNVNVNFAVQSVTNSHQILSPKHCFLYYYFTTDIKYKISKAVIIKCIFTLA